MAKADKPRDLGLGEDLSFPVTAAPPANIPTNQPTSLSPKKIKKPRRKLPHPNLEIKKLPHPSLKQFLKIAVVVTLALCLFLVTKVTYDKLISPKFSKSTLSLTCDAPFNFTPRHYPFTKESDCQALRCTYNGTTKEGDPYWCSQGSKENPLTCNTKLNGKFTCSTPVGKCEVLRLSTDNNCSSAITYDCSGCATDQKTSLFSFSPQNPFVAISPPIIPQLPKTSLTFPRSFSDFSQLISQAVTFIQLGFSSIKNNQ